MASPVEQQWFRLADQDGDGAVGGAEAVRFFTKSGLPQEVLGQIWEFSSRGAPSLNPAQFSVALRLVSLAQASGGRLAPEQARLIVMGGGPPLPPPRLAGVTDTPPTPSIPTYTPQITGLTPQVTGSGPYSGQMTGGTPGLPYTPQATGVRPPMGAGGYAPPPGSVGYPVTQQPTGGPPYMSGPPSGGMPGMAGAASLAAPAAAGFTGGGPVVYPPGYTPPSPADMQRYCAVFASTDADRDGFVRGSECFPVFMQSGLDKVALKAMWDLVAGNAGQLNRDQFVRCMFLMDGMRRGLALPTVLPPGPWPQAAPTAGYTGGAVPGGYGPPSGSGAAPQPPQPSWAPAAAAAAGGMGAAGLAGLSGPPSAGGGGVPGAPLRQESWSLSSQFGNKGAVKAVSEAYDQTLPKIPDPPGKVVFEGLGAPEAGPSMAPDLDTTVASMLAPADKARWEAERAEALKKEQEKAAAEAETANQKARLALFQEALSELVMYKSRVDVALLQAGDSAARLKSEAEDLERRYERAQLAAHSQAEAGSKARKQLQDLLAKKQEAQNKLTLLQQELEMAQNLNPEELVALEREVGLLVSQVATAESKKAALDMQLDSGRKQKGLLAERISELDMAAAAGEGELRRAREELGLLQGKVVSAEASSLSAEELGEVKPLLAKAASAYRRLYSTAAAAGIEVPYEANLSNVGSLVWLEQLMAGTADWVDDDGALSGYSVVNALPELEGVPPSLLRAAALAAAAQPPVKPTPVLGAPAPAPADGAPAAAATAGKGGPDAPAAEAGVAGAPDDAPAAASKEAAAAPAAGVAAAAEPAAAGDAAAAAQSAAAAAGAAGAAAAAEAPSAAVAAAPDAAGAAAAPARTVSVGKGKGKAAATGGAAAVAAGAAAVAAGAGVVAAATKAKAETPAAAAAADADAAAAEGGLAAAPSAQAAPAAPAADASATAAASDLPESLVAPAASGTLGAAASGALGAAASGKLGAAPSAAAGEAAVAADEQAAAAAPVASSSPPAAAAASPAAAAVSAPKTLLADSDSEAGDSSTPLSAAAAGAAVGGGGGIVPPFGTLAGFDPTMYRLPQHERALMQQPSIDSSYAGSFIERRSSLDTPSAGATGASTPSGAAAGGGDAGSFEDNAF